MQEASSDEEVWTDETGNESDASAEYYGRILEDEVEERERQEKAVASATKQPQATSSSTHPRTKPEMEKRRKNTHGKTIDRRKTRLGQNPADEIELPSEIIDTNDNNLQRRKGYER